MTEANITAKVTSEADRGAPIKSIIFPITFPINNEEDECENACWTICIAIKPGAKNSINVTPKTFGLSSPMAKVITDKKGISPITGMISELRYEIFDKHELFEILNRKWT